MLNTVRIHTQEETHILVYINILEHPHSWIVSGLYYILLQGISLFKSKFIEYKNTILTSHAVIALNKNKLSGVVFWKALTYWGMFILFFYELKFDTSGTFDKGYYLVKIEGYVRQVKWYV